MGAVVAIIDDSTFEEPAMIWGDTEDQVLEVVKAYLSATRPSMAEGKRMSLDEIAGCDRMADVQELLLDCRWVDLTWYSSAPGSADGWLRRPDHVAAWIRGNSQALFRQHSPGVEDVPVDPQVGL